MNNKEIPPPICEICGKKQVDGDNINIIFYTHYGVFCENCNYLYYWKFNKPVAKVCKKIIKQIRRCNGRPNNWFEKFLKKIHIL